MLLRYLLEARIEGSLIKSIIDLALILVHIKLKTIIKTSSRNLEQRATFFIVVPIKLFRCIMENK